MGGFVGAHLGDDRPAAGILGGQAIHVAVQMLLHLAFGLGHKAQADPVADTAGHGPNGVGTGVPQRAQPARAAIQFAQPLGAPGQMVLFLDRGLEQMLAQRWVAGDRCLPVVQRLGRNLAGVVDAHQPRSMRPGHALQRRAHGVIRRLWAGPRALWVRR